MKNLPYFGVASQQVTTHACQVKKIEGSFRGTTASWIQVHDSLTTPANNAVPIKSYPVVVASAANPIPFTFNFVAGELVILNGLYICVSTTDGTKTLSTDVMDLEVELTQAEEPSGVTVVGDLTTTINKLQVWAEASGPKRLCRIDVLTGIGGASKCLMLFAKTTSGGPVDGATPIAEFGKANSASWDTGTTYTFNFGKRGRDVISQDSAGGTIRKGCYLIVSDTRGTLTTNADGETSIRAEYV